MILIGAQQTASEVERRVVANCAVRVVGRLDAAEAGREQYGFLPAVQRQRATILKPGSMFVSQPRLPVPVLLEFPFPAWATRSAEAAAPADAPIGDPFAGLDLIHTAVTRLTSSRYQRVPPWSLVVRGNTIWEVG